MHNIDLFPSGTFMFPFWSWKEKGIGIDVILSNKVFLFFFLTTKRKCDLMTPMCMLPNEYYRKYNFKSNKQKIKITHITGRAGRRDILAAL